MASWFKKAIMKNWWHKLASIEVWWHCRQLICSILMTKLIIKKKLMIF